MAENYGVPFYGASWIPVDKIINKKLKIEKVEGESKEEEHQEQEKGIAQSGKWIILGGGGGEGNSGIRNALLTTKFDSSSNTLSRNPDFELQIRNDLPYRLVVHPGGEGLLCSLSNSCRWFEWEMPDNILAPRLSEKNMTILENIGQQLAMTFSRDGSLLAVGGEDGYLRILEWPAMNVILDRADAHTTVKDLDFSSDGKFLVTLGGRSPCRIWDTTTLQIVASISKPKDAVFGHCSFSRDGSQILYTTASGDKGGSVIMWSTTSWGRIKSRRIGKDAFSALTISDCGKLLAIGTVEGNVLILNSADLKTKVLVKKAHLGIATALSFSQDTRYLLSTSMDSSARVTRVEVTNENSSPLLAIVLCLLIAFLAILGYYLDEQRTLPSWLSKLSDLMR